MGSAFAARTRHFLPYHGQTLPPGGQFEIDTLNVAITDPIGRTGSG